MTPSDLITYILQRNNSVGDSMFGNALMLNLIYQASMEMAKKAYVIEEVYSSTTVASQSSYTLPTNTFAIKRVTYDGSRIDPISFKQYDSMRYQNSTTLPTGRPICYAMFDRVLYPLPVPDSALTLEIFSFNFAEPLTITSVLDVPTEYQLDLADFCLSEMAVMEKNYQGARFYRDRWEKRLNEIVKENRKRLRGADFTTVQNADVVAPYQVGYP